MDIKNDPSVNKVLLTACAHGGIAGALMVERYKVNFKYLIALTEGLDPHPNFVLLVRQILIPLLMERATSKN